MRVLFSSAGRRIELLQAFQRAAKVLGIGIEVHVSDMEKHFAAACLARRAHLVPPTTSSGYISALLEIVRRDKIDLMIPLIDTELPMLSANRDRIAAAGCHVIVSPPRIIDICRDKLETSRFLEENGIPAPRTWQPAEVMSRRRHKFPYFLKPRFGSASKGNAVIRNRDDLEAFVPRVPDAIVQEMLPGHEHTLDVYAGYDGKPRCVVPRRRLEVRGGEVVTAITVRHEAIMQTGARVVEALRDCLGVVTIQLFLAPQGQIHVIEINPRFGGGVPLSIQAGADFPKWLLAEWLGRSPRIRFDNFRDGVMMLRYHQSFFKNRVPQP